MPNTYSGIQPAADYLFTYSDTRREAYRSGKLWQDWRKSYPMLFDERDEQLARNMAASEQGGSGFFEWLSAVLLYEATGLLSMQTNYVAKNHPEKRRHFEQMVGKESFDHVDLDQSGLPDLFVYPEDEHGDWFFCEVKGSSDKLRANQIDRHASLFGATGKKVKIIRLIELKI